MQKIGTFLCKKQSRGFPNTTVATGDDGDFSLQFFCIMNRKFAIGNWFQSFFRAGFILFLQWPNFHFFFRYDTVLFSASTRK